MFVGNWQVGVCYYLEDIVYVPQTCMYFACQLEHVSTTLGLPCKDDMYWVYVDYGNNGNNVNNEEKSDLKRKLDAEEENVNDYRRKRSRHDVTSLRDELLLMNIDVSTKAFVIDKYDNTTMMNGSEYTKGMSWLKTVASLPHGKQKELEVKLGDDPQKIKDFFKKVKDTLDKRIYGLEDVKQEILEFVARKITNPNGKGDVLALCGSPGVGKSKIIKSLAEALELPFVQLNCGGLNDVAMLIGHSETYVGAKAGKIVEGLQNAQYMNPILYLDEIDKISDTKAQEINGVFTHLLDEEQNNNFQDNYLANIPLDLSKVFFVIAFNDITKVDSIVSDRMKIIYIDKPSLEDKVIISQEKLLPDIIENMKLNFCVQMNKEVIEFIITQKCHTECGVRQLKKTIEKILNKLNYDILVGNEKVIDKVYNITRSYVDKTIVGVVEEKEYLSMYN